MKTLILRRYMNRKLYSNVEKKYVNLTQIKDYLKQGYTITIIDNVTKANVTTQILARGMIELMSSHPFSFGPSLNKEQLKQALTQNINSILE